LPNNRTCPTLLEPMKVNIHHIFISPGHNFIGHYGKPPGTNASEPLESVQCIAGKGLVGDRFFEHETDYKGQITFFDMAVFNRMVKTLGADKVAPNAMRRNVLIEGIDLNSLIGKAFQIDNLQFEGSEECSPCFWMNEAVADGALDFLVNQGGLRARILTDGWLNTGQADLTILSESS